MRAPNARHTWEDYLLVEETSGTKHEFFDGRIYAMTGGSVAHALLAGNIGGLLYAALRGGSCRVFNADLRVRVEASGLGTYPDVTIICGTVLYDDDARRSSALNPRVIVEVLSDSTEAYDRTTKFAHYRSIPSLQEYVLVSHRERLIEAFLRPVGSGDEWLRTEARSGALALASLDARLVVDEVYEGVEL